MKNKKNLSRKRLYYLLILHNLEWNVSLNQADQMSPGKYYSQYPELQHIQ